MKKNAAKYLAALLVFLLPGAYADQNKLVDLLVSKGTLSAEEGASLKSQTIQPANKFLDQLILRGRVQAQFGYVDAKNDAASGDYSTFELRRAYLGIRGEFPDHLRSELEVNMVPGDGADEFAVTTAYIQWYRHPMATVKAGFDKPLTSLDENYSTASMHAVERSFVNSTLAAPGEQTGLFLEGDLAPFFYGVALLTDQSNANTANADVHYLYNARAGVHLNGLCGQGSKLKLLASHLASQDPDGKLVYDDLSVVSLHFSQGGADLRAEYMTGGKEGGDTSGFYIMPAYMFTKKVQGVVRYEQADSDAAEGLRATSRYTRRADFLAVTETENADGSITSFDPQRGDGYQALYLGVNYYANGLGNVIMLGVEQSALENTQAGTLDATTAYTAWRTLF